MWKDFKWTYFLLIPVSAVILTVWGTYVSNFQSEILNNITIGLMDTIIIWLGCMGIVGMLWKMYPWEQKPVVHLILEVFLVITYTVLISKFLFWIQDKMGLLEYNAEEARESTNISILITLFITSLHEAYFFYKQWVENFSKSVKLEKDNINAKYEALKAQINPHFLFNSLNSLVTLVDGNEVATTYIMDLSDFLRYMLKSREREVVLVREENEVLAKYIHLQKTRFGENLIVENNIDEKYFHYALPPLVLQILVENCIKHNVISKDKPLQIKIFVKDEYIKVENNYQKKENVSSTGSGLKNIEERYRFLTSKKMEIKQTNRTFTVSVPIVLVDL